MPKIPVGPSTARASPEILLRDPIVNRTRELGANSGNHDRYIRRYLPIPHYPHRKRPIATADLPRGPGVKLPTSHPSTWRTRVPGPPSRFPRYYPPFSPSQAGAAPAEPPGAELCRRLSRCFFHRRSLSAGSIRAAALLRDLADLAVLEGTPPCEGREKDFGRATVSGIVSAACVPAVEGARREGSGLSWMEVVPDAMGKFLPISWPRMGETIRGCVSMGLMAMAGRLVGIGGWGVALDGRGASMLGRMEVGASRTGETLLASVFSGAGAAAAENDRLDSELIDVLREIGFLGGWGWVSSATSMGSNASSAVCMAGLTTSTL